MKLKDIKIGKTDAKNELLAGTPEEISFFENTYIIPPNIVIEDFIERKSYFVVGRKGTGKTALLRFISLALEKEHPTPSEFVLFKSHFDSEDKQELSRAHQVSVNDDSSEGNKLDEYDSVWRWFFYKTVVRSIEKGAEPFQKNSVLGDFIDIVNITGRSSGSFSSLIPRLKRGRLTVSKSPKFEIDFEWGSKGEKQIDFRQLVKKAEILFSQLSPGRDALNLFFDELEISHAKKSQYEKDVKLIRDLILSVERFNAECKSNGFNICIYAAIRSEVRNVISVSGRELNKPLDDFGVEISWHQPREDIEVQPLLKIITSKINKSRELNGLNELGSTEVWGEYFPELIQKDSPQKHILHNSWYRPRDIVHLLRSAIKQFPEESFFKRSVFDGVRKSYSSAVWAEMIEELRATYKASEVEAIETMLYGEKQVLEYHKFYDDVQKKIAFYPEIASLLENHALPAVLKDLYRVGVIGNINWDDWGNVKMRFSFRGDEQMIMTQKIFIHNALKSRLSIM